MKIVILDTEYLSLSKRYSDYKNLVKFKKKIFPEIIQISFLELSNIFSQKCKKKKLNSYIKINQRIPKRISKLTGITEQLLLKKGYSLKEVVGFIDKFIKKESILIANGEDIKLIKFNIKNSNITRENKKLIYYVNLKYVFNKINKKKNFDTQNLNKIFNFKTNLKVHNSYNDCKIIYESLKRLIKFYGEKKIKKIINQNKKLIYF